MKQRIAAVCLMLVPLNASAELPDAVANAQLNRMLPMVRGGFVTEEYNESGMRGLAVTVEAPRTLVYEYEFEFSLSETVMTLEEFGKHREGMSAQLYSTWCGDPALRYWRDNSLYQSWIYRDRSGEMLARIDSEEFDCAAE